MTPAGQLNRRVRVEYPVDTTNDYGEPETVWTLNSVRWASIVPLTGREGEQARQVVAETTHKVGMRYFAGLEKTWRLKYGTRVLQIVSAQNVDEGNAEWQLLCVESD